MAHVSSSSAQADDPVIRDNADWRGGLAGLIRCLWDARFRGHDKLRIVGGNASLRFPHPLASTVLVATAALVVVPLLSLVRTAAGGDNEIWSHLIAYVLPSALVDTALLLAGVAVITLVVGVGTAWIVTAYQFPGRDAFLWLLPLPLAIPTYIVAYVYVDILDAGGPVQAALRQMFGWRTAADYWFPSIRSLGSAVFVMGFVLYPYVYLAARAMFQTQSPATIEIARSLGASGWRVARDITLPLARPAIAAGLSLALLETLNDIGASEYLGVRTLTLSVFTTWLNRGSLAGAAQIACVMLLAIAFLIAMERAGRRGKNFAGAERDAKVAWRVPLRGKWRWLAAGACLAPAAVGFLVPLVFLAYQVAVRTSLMGIDPALLQHAATTVAFAAGATAITLAIGFSACFAERLVRRPFAALCVAIAGLGYAVPGTVLALGLLPPLVSVDEGVNWLARTAAESSVGLVLTASGGAVIVAYVVRFLAIATGFAQAGLTRIPSELDDAARTLGARPARLLRSIHLPLARPALMGAALLVFVDCLKELPATLLLRPLNVETLSTYIYQFATRGSFEDGALAALLIVLVGLLPVIRMVRFADASPGREPVNPVR
jgi:iron(III) transport system permease protein